MCTDVLLSNAAVCTPACVAGFECNAPDTCSREKIETY